MHDSISNVNSVKQYNYSVSPLQTTISSVQLINILSNASFSSCFFYCLQNIQSTSERALRSGDGGTIADLVLSHHKSLQLMADYCQQIEISVREMEAEKASLTRHIHIKLQQVTEIQKRVADSNSQLVLLHEHVKLAKKRFEILEQVCSTPQVLARVLSEVERRRMYSSSLEKVSLSEFLNCSHNT